MAVAYTSTGPGIVGIAPDLALYCSVQVIAFVPCLLVVRRYWPDHKDPWTLADTLVSLGIFPLLTGSAIIGSLELRHELDSRWYGRTTFSSFFMTLYATRAFFHMFVQCKQKMPPNHFMMMTLHHGLSMICYGCGLATGRMHFWGCLDGCCEMSTIFLNNVYMTKELTYNGKELKEFMPGWMYAINGVILWLSFLIFRLVLFPVWLFSWYQDVTAFPGKTWDRVSLIERYMHPGVTAFLFFLSAFWFISVTKGMLKAVGLSGGAKKDKKKQ